MVMSLFSKDNPLLAEAYWQPGETLVNLERSQAVNRALARTCRTVTYINQTNDINEKKAEKAIFTGYFDHSALKFEPLALYIRALFGDGFYYTELDDQGKVYLLIIKDGVIMPGSDLLITKSLFTLLLNSKQAGEYAQLNIVKLTNEHIETMLEHYQANQKLLLRGRMIKWSVFILVLLILALIPLIFFIWA